jgi:hypothetical protein
VFLFIECVLFVVAGFLRVYSSCCGSFRARFSGGEKGSACVLDRGAAAAHDHVLVAVSHGKKNAEKERVIKQYNTKRTHVFIISRTSLCVDDY